MNKVQKSAVAAVAFATLLVGAPSFAAGMHDFTSHLQNEITITSGNSAGYKTLFGSRDYQRKEQEAANRKHGNLPGKHIDFCNRQVSDYRVSDNTIAVDRYTREQCFSPYYRPY